MSDDDEPIEQKWVGT